MKTSLWLCLTLGLLTAHTVYAAAIDEMNDLDYEYDGDEAIDQGCPHFQLMVNPGQTDEGSCSGLYKKTKGYMRSRIFLINQEQECFMFHNGDAWSLAETSSYVDVFRGSKDAVYSAQPGRENRANKADWSPRYRVVC